MLIICTKRASIVDIVFPYQSREAAPMCAPGLKTSGPELFPVAPQSPLRHPTLAHLAAQGEGCAESLPCFTRRGVLM